MKLLQKFHIQGYSHNDITTHKLLFDSDGASVKIIGLGRAKEAVGEAGKKLQRGDFRALEEVLNSAETARVEHAEGPRPSNRPRKNADPGTSVLHTVSAVLLGPLETANIQLVLEEISRWMREDSTFPSGKITRLPDMFLYMEFSCREDGAHFRKIWESEDSRLKIPLQQWERRGKIAL